MKKINIKKQANPQYINYTRLYIKNEIKEIENALIEKLNKAEKSGAIPDEWFETGNHLLKSAIIDSFCLDRPYQMRDKAYQKQAKNLHLFI